MSSWVSWLTGKQTSTKDSAVNTIISLRQHVLLLEKNEDHLYKKIEEETAKAKANATTNKTAALNALRQKKKYEEQVKNIAGRRSTLLDQVNALESANMNLETMQAMKEGANVLKRIHNGLTIDKVDATMESIQEQMVLQKEISDAISNPVGLGNEVDEDDLKAELDELEQEQLDERLAGAHAVPATLPPRVDPVRAAPAKTREEADEEEELRQLQAELAM